MSILFSIAAAFAFALLHQLMVQIAISRYSTEFGFSWPDFLSDALGMLVAIAAASGMVVVLKRWSSSSVTVVSAMFIVGVSVLPLAVAALLASIIIAFLPNSLGAGIGSLFLLFGACYLVLLLNTGLRRIVMMDERRAVPATPAVLSVALVASSIVAWLF